MNLEAHVYGTIRTSEAFKFVDQQIKAHRLHKNRLAALEEKVEIGYNMCCGTGGVGSIRVRKFGLVFVQVTCGKSQYNYADLAFIGRLEKSEDGQFIFKPKF